MATTHTSRWGSQSRRKVSIALPLGSFGPRFPNTRTRALQVKARRESDDLLARWLVKAQRRPEAARVLRRVKLATAELAELEQCS